MNLDDTLSFTMKLTNGTKIQREGVVVGAYTKFPASYMERSYDESVDFEIYMSFDLLQDARIELVEFIYYSQADFSILEKSYISQYINEHFSADYSLRFLDIGRYHDEFDAKTFELFQIEGYLLIIFALFGFFIYSLIDTLHSDAEIAVLRSKGLLEKDLIRSSLFETLILVGIGSILALISTLGTKGLILYN